MRLSAISALILTTLLCLACSSNKKTESGGAPQIAQLTTEPNPAVAPRIRFTATGSGFDPKNMKVFFKGPGCPDGCRVPEFAIDIRTDSKISGLADLGVGTYQFSLQNPDGKMSNAVDLKLIAAVKP